MKTIFSLVLIFAVTSFSTCAFSSPGRRTYLGSDTENEVEVSQEASQDMPSLPLTESRDLAEKAPQEQIQEQISKEDLLENETSVRAINELVLTKQIYSEKDISDQNVSIEELKNTLSQAENSSVGNSTEVSKTTISQQPIISHEGIPLKWEYKQ